MTEQLNTASGTEVQALNRKISTLRFHLMIGYAALFAVLVIGIAIFNVVYPAFGRPFTDSLLFSIGSAFVSLGLPVGLIMFSEHRELRSVEEALESALVHKSS